jgi:hypothetical protein
LFPPKYDGIQLQFFTIDRYGSLDGRGAAWHPTRAFHMLRGEAIVWIFSLIMYETLSMYEQDALTKTKKEMLDGKQ